MLLQGISIHALLAESDHHRGVNLLGFKDFYPRSPCGERLFSTYLQIREVLFLSTLSLRRATPQRQYALYGRVYFYPRSPCGERQRHHRKAADRGYFYPRSPCGERRLPRGRFPIFYLISIHALLAESDPNTDIIILDEYQFLSTLSLRRATLMWYQCNTVVKISIHALLAESDGLSYFYIIKITVFLSTLSLRRATSTPTTVVTLICISIHALLAESDRF